MRIGIIGLAVLAICATVWAGPVSFEEKVAYGGWANCVRISNGTVELIVTTDVGPRIIRFGFKDGQNLFKEFPEDMGQTGGATWRPFGGHRLWHAPEAKPRTYSPDNAPVPYAWDGKTLVLTPAAEPETGIQKTMAITLEPDGRVHIVHTLANQGLWEVTLAPWALTMMAQGGRAVYPQAPYRAHTDYLLPARPLVLWHYTDMSDPRWTWGEKFIQFRQDPQAKKPNKIGISNQLGWAAYTLGPDVFIKRYAYNPEATYPDFGCNTETFSNDAMLEVETVGPMTPLAPGASVSHIEDWYLFKADLGQTDASIETAINPLLQKTAAVQP